MAGDDKRPSGSAADPANLPSERDALFVEGASAPTEFRFDEAVARVFPDMLRRSIPGYPALLHLIGVVAGRTLPSGGTAYDLGCSLGAVSLAMRHAIGTREARIIAIDNSSAMVERCRDIMSADSGLCPVDVRQGDITRLELEPCSLVVLNFTLQFAPVTERARILRQIAEALQPEGVLILSEKTQPTSPGDQAFFAETHDAFRSSNGYSHMEMSRKREALDQVLVPESPERYEQLMSEAGFDVTEWFRCLHFVSWVGKKPS